MNHRALFAVAVAAAVAAVTTATMNLADARPRPRPGRKFVANKTFGLGAMVGTPAGLSGKWFYGRTTAFDFGVGVSRFYRKGRDGVHAHADHLWHPVSLAHNAAFELPLYFGIGARLLDFEDGGTALGVRVPVGVAFDFNKVPFDIFIEAAVVGDAFLDIDDDDDHDYGRADVQIAVGARYYFGS